MCFYVPGLRVGKGNKCEEGTWTTLSGRFIIFQTIITSQPGPPKISDQVWGKGLASL